MQIIWHHVLTDRLIMMMLYYFLTLLHGYQLSLYKDMVYYNLFLILYVVFKAYECRSFDDDLYKLSGTFLNRHLDMFYSIPVSIVLLELTVFFCVFSNLQSQDGTMHPAPAGPAKFQRDTAFYMLNLHQHIQAVPFQGHTIC